MTLSWLRSRNPDCKIACIEVSKIADLIIFDAANPGMVYAVNHDSADTIASCDCVEPHSSSNDIEACIVADEIC